MSRGRCRVFRCQIEAGVGEIPDHLVNGIANPTRSLGAPGQALSPAVREGLLDWRQFGSLPGTCAAHAATAALDSRIA